MEGVGGFMIYVRFLRVYSGMGRALWRMDMVRPCDVGILGMISFTKMEREGQSLDF